MAKYVFSQRSYWFDRLIESGEEVEVPDNITPGPHMKPVDEAAKAKALAEKIEYTGEVPDVLNTVLMPEYEKVLAEAKAKGQAVDVKGLVEAIKQAFAEIANPGTREASFNDAVSAAVKARVDELETSIDKRVGELVMAELERVRKANADKKAAAAAGEGEPTPVTSTASEDKKADPKKK